MYKIGICGCFAIENENVVNGQTIKTKSLYEELLVVFSKEQIKIIDTYNWKQNPFKFLVMCIKEFKNIKNLIILPAQNGVKIFVPLYTLINKIYKNKLYYVVIGGWLPELIKNKKYLIKYLSRFEKIFVETNGMKEKLYELKLSNVEVLTNFKRLSIVSKEDIITNYELPHKVCTFSRVLKEKGIEDAINAIKYINNSYEKKIYELDIYGPIDNRYKSEFDLLMNDQPDFIMYKGVIDYKDTVKILKEYYLVLFPTHYESEGVAGTIIDSLSSGVPVIASNCRSNIEILTDGVDGYLYPAHDNNQLIKILTDIHINNSITKSMKIKCIDSAKKYNPSVALKPLLKELVK